jgi:hypothetical protein
VARSRKVSVLDLSGSNKLANGSITKAIAGVLKISYSGCPHRGTTQCLDCALAVWVAKECAYDCDECTDRRVCPCGQSRDVACVCGGRLEVVVLHYNGRQRWAHRCVVCGALWSKGAWHLDCDEVLSGAGTEGAPTL